MGAQVQLMCAAVCGQGCPYALELGAEAALKQASRRRYRVGEIVIREGDESREAYVVRSGRFMVSIRSSPEFRRKMGGLARERQLGRS